MTDKLCPECGHAVDLHEVGIGCLLALDDHSCRCDLDPRSIELIDEARALARRFYAERNEAVADYQMLDAASAGAVEAQHEEVKRLRLLIMNSEIINYCEPSVISDGFGNWTFAWCRHCGGDVQVVRPGVFGCGECGK